MTPNMRIKDALGEFLTTELVKVAPEVDWFDGRYMEELVEGAFKAMVLAAAAQPKTAQHCQNGRADVCLAAQADDVVCPEDSCDIDDGMRSVPVTEKSQYHGKRYVTFSDAGITIDLAAFLKSDAGRKLLASQGDISRGLIEVDGDTVRDHTSTLRQVRALLNRTPSLQGREYNNLGHDFNRAITYFESLARSCDEAKRNG